MWTYLGAVLGITAIVSGAYPAFYIFGLEPAGILKGQGPRRGRQLFTRVFLTFQFILTFVTIIGTVVMWQNNRFQGERDWGYDQSDLLVARVEESHQAEVFKNKLQTLPDVLAVGSARHNIGTSWSGQTAWVGGTKLATAQFEIGEGYLETIGVRLTRGRMFDASSESERQGSILVTEAFVENMGWDDGIDRTVRLDSTTYTVIGVVEDVVYRSFMRQQRPVIFRLAAKENYRHLAVKIRAGSLVRTREQIEAAWKELFPDALSNISFQDDIFEALFRENANVTKVFGFTGTMALIIALMGLFGLSAQNIEQRLKEIAIRKVLGASLRRVAGLVNSWFLALLLLAAVVSGPLGYVMLDKLLDSVFEYRMQIGTFPFLFAFGVVLVGATVTLATLFARVANANPAVVLRNE